MANFLIILTMNRADVSPVVRQNVGVFLPATGQLVEFEGPAECLIPTGSLGWLILLEFVFFFWPDASEYRQSDAPD